MQDRYWLSVNRILTSISCTTFLLASILLLSGAAARPSLATRSLDPAKLHKMDEEIQQVIEDGQCPGGVLWVEHGKSKYSKAFGDRAIVPDREEMTKDTIFDIASLTKVVAGTPA